MSITLRRVGWLSTISAFFVDNPPDARRVVDSTKVRPRKGVALSGKWLRRLSGEAGQDCGRNGYAAVAGGSFDGRNGYAASGAGASAGGVAVEFCASGAGDDAKDSDGVCARGRV